jgi:hypothetical protein
MGLVAGTPQRYIRQAQGQEIGHLWHFRQEDQDQPVH